MLAKELEILRTIEELYHGDTTEQEMLDFAEKNQAKIQAWKEAFNDYDLYDITKAINHFYVKKSSKTRPNIAQITAILQENNAQRETTTDVEKVEPSIGLKYQIEDRETGNMHWFVHDYFTVEKLIRKGVYQFVYNYQHPTKDEFDRCMEMWCEETTGHKYRFYSRKDIDRMSEDEKERLWHKCEEMVKAFKPKILN